MDKKFKFFVPDLKWPRSPGGKEVNRNQFQSWVAWNVFAGTLNNMYMITS